MSLSLSLTPITIVVSECNRNIRNGWLLLVVVMQALATHLRLAFLGKDPENLTHSRVRIAQAIHLSASGETNKSPFETAFQAKLTAAVLIQKYHEASLGYDSSIILYV